MLLSSLKRPLALLTALMLSAQAHAALSLDRVIVYFKPDELPRQDVVVFNPDPENLYLQTEVYHVINPGTEQEERVRVTDPEKLKLLATPAKAIIPPNSRKTVRLVSLETPQDKELVYRVTFRPMVGELEAQQTAIKILVAYQALVFVRPQNPEYNVAATVSNGKMMFINSGNMNVVLRNGKYCISEDICTNLDDGTRIYAGGSWEMPLPEGSAPGRGYIQYGMFDGEFEEAQRFAL
ncbi:molecular chaperone [Endozoicomonas sp. SCSIO W0465]|uniref:fimbrial biogenesis chaperone n=1 Tax=Endozoicomonas sp. SCSIO W0465 TaxID=2918516 RepID=UPI0020757348|nr:fimbria/pilus periplasmic chaperone [Endozoicomonas sp. SCSIO W0465]USE39346.1 fimbria/pilus periplasmic chaperone [Endozoicomonas sp. SCSIO W0465]